MSSISPSRETNPIWYIFAFIFGLIYALFLSCTALGRYLANKRTWITVVIGVIANMLLALPNTANRADWQRIVNLFTLSSIPIIARSLLQEQTKDDRIFDRVKEKIDAQNNARQRAQRP